MAANILVVEDEPAIQELIAVNLQHAGHHVSARAMPRALWASFAMRCPTCC